MRNSHRRLDERAGGERTSEQRKEQGAGERRARQEGAREGWAREGWARDQRKGGSGQAIRTFRRKRSARSVGTHLGKEEWPKDQRYP